MSEYKAIIEAFIEKNKAASLLVVLLLSVGSLVMDFSTQTTKEYVAITESHKATIANLETKLELQSKELLVLRTEILTLKDDFIQLENNGAEFPFPYWIKSVGSQRSPGIMLYMNSAYGEWFLEPEGRSRRDYLFKTDAVFWGIELGTQYWEGDLEVIRSRKTIYKLAPHPLYPAKLTYVIKWPYIKHGELFAIGGVVIPKEFN